MERLEELWYELRPFGLLVLGLFTLIETSMLGKMCGLFLCIIAVSIIKMRLSHRKSETRYEALWYEIKPYVYLGAGISILQNINHYGIPFAIMLCLVSSLVIFMRLQYRNWAGVAHA